MLLTMSESRAEPPPAIVVWENVPGVLSSKDNAFGCFLAALAGDREPYEPPARGKRKSWPDAGVVFGPQRAIAWRVVDAQYFGLAQRRRRVFLVASARDDFHPAQCLFEWDGVRRDTAPSRKAREEVAAATGTCAALRCGCGYEFDGALGKYGCPNCEGDEGPAEPVDAFPSTMCMAHGQGGAEIARERSPTLTCNHEAPIVVHGTQDPDVLIDCAHPLGRNTGQENAVCVTGSITHTLRAEGFDASEDGTGRGQPIIAFSCKDHSGDAGAVSPTLRSMGHVGSHANAGGQVAVCYDTTQITSPDNGCNPKLGDPCHPLAAGAHPPLLVNEGVEPYAIQAGALRTNPACGPVGIGVQEGFAYTLEARAEVQVVAFSSHPYVVRRLIPTECERLQGFPDGHTRIRWRKKVEADCPDGPRYKALGNSMAVNCMRWLGRRIEYALSRPWR